MIEIAVLDDSANFVEAMIDSLKSSGFAAEGFTSLREFGRAARNGSLRNARLMLIDMNLGPAVGGGTLKAPDAILIAKTYVPNAYVLVFTANTAGSGINLDDCIECVSLGALGLVPKPQTQEELLKVADAYANVGSREHATEAVIGELWAQLQNASASQKGALFEMLVANLLSTVEGFSFVGNNWNGLTGEIDLAFRNDASDRFWTELKSLLILVECKNRVEPSETSDFSIFRDKVRAKGGCQVGIMASWEPVTRGFKILRQFHDKDAVIFIIDEANLRAMVGMAPAAREPYLRTQFTEQL